MWMSDVNPRKYTSYLGTTAANPQDTGTPSVVVRGDNDHLMGSGSFGSSGLTSPSVRRSRADTMPSRPSFPYGPMTNAPSSQEDLFAAAMSTASSSSSSLQPPTATGRHRSGSMTLPATEGFNNALLPPPSMGYSSLVDESVASTMASLGLDEHHDAPSHPPQQQQHVHHHQHPQNPHHHRHRAYTVATRAPTTSLNTITPSIAAAASNTSLASSNSSSDRLGDSLSLGFSPFSPQTRTSLQRPRAISLGMADDTFSPFDMSTPIASHLNPPQQQQQQQTLHHPPHPSHHFLDQQRSLRMSRSSGNLLDMSQPRFDMDELIPDEINAMPSVSSSTSAALDSPSSTPSQVPSRALWIGNINPSISVNDLMQQFSLYGPVESARILSDKECGFVNFIHVESAVAAKNDLETRLGSKLGGTAVRVGFGKADVALAMALTNEAGPNAQGPTRSLWVGNIPSNTNAAMLQSVFQGFGRIESIRILSHKNCGFINFEHQEDAVLARKTLQNKEILGSGSGTVRIGFAKAPTAEDLSSADVYLTRMHLHQSVQQPSVQPSSVQPSVQQPSSIQQQQPSPVQQQQQQMQAMQQVPSAQQPMPILQAAPPPSAAQPANTSTNPSIDTYQAAQWATAMMMTTMMSATSNHNNNNNHHGHTPNQPQPSLYAALAAERQFIMKQLGHQENHHQLQERHTVSYFSVIPPVPELSADRTLEPLRLREIRKRLESGQAIQDVEIIAQECMHEIVELCSDYIGNVIVQRLFEHCAEQTKDQMLQRIAPYLAAIGVHKNGTWAVQKIIDHANSPIQFELIRQHIAPYVPLLLLDQFGNYVVQCCLMRMGQEQNQYIFDAIVDKCWEIGQGRFGARAVRAILETSVVTREQRIYCAAAIVQNAVLLTTNANGTLLLVWFLDTSDFAGRYKVLCPRLLPHLSKLCTHKLGSMTVFKLIQQNEDPDTAALVLNTLTTDDHVLDDVLRDQIHGVTLLQKILALPTMKKDRHKALVTQVHASLDRLKAHHIQGYKKLFDELAIPTSSSSSSSSSTTPNLENQNQNHNHLNASTPDPQDNVDMAAWMKDPQAVAMMANMYAAAMTASASSSSPNNLNPNAATAVPLNNDQQTQLPMPDMPQLPHILRQIMQSSNKNANVAANAHDDPKQL